MPAAAIGAGVSGVGSIVGGILGSNASSKAAKIQAANANRVADMAQTATSGAQKGEGEALGAATSRLNEVYGQEKDNLNPYLAAGQTGATTANQLMQPGGLLTQQFSFNPADLENDPGYQFQMKQGLQAVQRSAAAQGQNTSGGTLKALTQYGQGLASTEYGNAYQRAMNTFNLNQGNTRANIGLLTGIGQTATNQFQSAAQNYGNLSAEDTLRSAEYQGNAGLKGTQIVGDALTGGANAQAAGVVGSANAWTGAIGGLANAAQYYGLSKLPQSAPTGPAGFVPYSQGMPWTGNINQLPSYAGAPGSGAGMPYIPGVTQVQQPTAAGL